MNAMTPKDKPLSRRGFLGWLGKGSLAGAALLGLGALGRFISYQSQAGSPREFDLGPTSDYPAGSRTAMPEIPVLIIHDEQGFKALSLVCPHLGCSVTLTDEGFTCPCHGSRFYSDGSLRNGPASHPLSSMKVEVNEAGHLILHQE
jgi:cytochrome b6-f complex iron-sulfur subunit